jgi:hypothetical protein
VGRLFGPVGWGVIWASPLAADLFHWAQKLFIVLLLFRKNETAVFFQNPKANRRLLVTNLRIRIVTGREIRGEKSKQERREQR